MGETTFSIIAIPCCISYTLIMFIAWLVYCIIDRSKEWLDGREL